MKGIFLIITRNTEKFKKVLAEETDSGCVARGDML